MRTENIVVGTTPTIQWTFSTVDVADIEVATMTIKKSGEIIITKEIDSATVGESEIAWTLSQSETLTMGTGTCEIMLNWLTTDGTRGVGATLKINGLRNHITEVMTDG